MSYNLPKVYNPQSVEDDIYARWEQSGFFDPNNLPGDREKTFTISMPPPNATGQLHLGHAVMLAIEDIFTRFARMNGKAALWVPGTDHAAIATESLVIKNLQQEGIEDPRAHFGREKLVERIADFVDQSRSTIRNQIKKMGSSCDWSRERYTLDPTLNRVVSEVFIKMYNDGLIYRGSRIVNWDPSMKTTVADDEIEWYEEKDPFYYLQYGPFVIATARPETKFGDKYVVMHPDDKRYAKYKHGDTFECEWINGKITATVIKDSVIDHEFGSGVMTITPWHDATDFDIAERHGLDKEQIIDFDGKLLPIAGEFAGLPIDEARKKIVEKLDKKGLLVKVDTDYVHNVARSYRGKGKIEPQIKEQWFIDVHKKAVTWKGQKMSLKEVMQDTVRSGDIKIVPEKFEKIYFHWIDNLRDWCVSRQIWWGHRVPVYYRKQEKSKLQTPNTKKEENIYVGVKPPEGDGWQQDPDTLDTWFSSALWTWSTLIDPKLTEDNSLSLEEIIAKSPDFKQFHPTQIMETGYDILFFWVARMILMTTYSTGQIPFENVYLHGLIRTRDGRKMSKSDPETMIDPLDMIKEFGTDALRLSMIVGQTPGNDSRLYKEKIAGYRNFINKIWNISRFIITNVDDAHTVEYPPKPKTLADKWILHLFETHKNLITHNIENFHLSLAFEGLYRFTWSEFADWYIEISKEQMKNSELKNSTEDILLYILTNTLKLFHPVIPYITEHIWEKLNPSKLLIISKWPDQYPELKDELINKNFVSIKNIVIAIRNFKSENNINPKQILDIHIHGTDNKLINENKYVITSQAGVKFIDHPAIQRPQIHVDGFDVSISVPSNPALKKKRDKERKKLEEYITSLEKKLANKEFTEKAPASVVEKERKKLEHAREKNEKMK